MSCLAYTCRQASATARISGKYDIFFAAQFGDVALLQEHLFWGASYVNSRDKDL